ncbi:pancortin-3 [Pseudomonas sp. C2B4]|uniref:Cap15 family cyclic dinucleotide receptor domain-containing protein n=1 Tax=Pseudomonas sp. C2B4 TaxID=2735270 RepID=UPI00158638B8|nr:pancortin-3 [Pseudomonas sp. C2B4]NUU35123.1 pancortin-3 [Pseudomonas sp. C2B4]
MHDYAVFGHDRAVIGRWLGVISILGAGAISQLMDFASTASQWGILSKATVTTGAIYFAVHWIFNKWIWRVPILDIPNLQGEWDVEAKTLNEDGSVRWNWVGIIGIEQNWKQIVIHLETAQSESLSYTAIFMKRDSPIGGWMLSYSYSNESRLEVSHELSSHKGYCEIMLNKELTLGKASYFNRNGRNTFGVMTLTRRVK